jgi:hypothetical protein
MRPRICANCDRSLEAWRAAKSVALKTIVQMLVTGLMVAMLAGFAALVWKQKN